MIEYAPRDNDIHWNRLVWRASKIIVNDPDHNESIFQIPIPEGYLVDDQITGKKYKKTNQ